MDKLIFRAFTIIAIIALIVGICLMVAGPAETGAHYVPYPGPATPCPPICPGEVAPNETFADVGDVAYLSGSHGISGKAIVAGLQTLIITRFNYDGTGSDVDIRLVNGDDYGNAVAKFVHLERRAYHNEFFILCIPNSAQVADRIVVYSMDEGMYAEGIFEGTKPRPTWTPHPTLGPTVNPKLTPTATRKAVRQKVSTETKGEMK